MDPRGQGKYISTTFCGKNKCQLTKTLPSLKALTGGKHLCITNNASPWNIWQYSKILPKERCHQGTTMKHQRTAGSSSCHHFTAGCNKKEAKRHTIEWLHISTGVEDSFVAIFGEQPSTTTIHKE
jgi:hypothetical protein